MANSYTRFRAYQLKEKGASFSYSVDGNFTLIEARYNETNKPSIKHELQMAQCKYLTKLHITSWDSDHCKANELKDILSELRPTIIEAPGYEPDTDNGKESLRLINRYGSVNNYAIVIRFSPKYIDGLEVAECGKYSDVVLNPMTISTTCHNDNSTVKLFRRGRFTVLSLGDLESAYIADSIAQSKMVRTETDIMLVAHHGADNGFTTPDFVSSIRPRIGVCCNDWDNTYGHPSEKVRGIFQRQNIPLYTTKTGDVLVVCGEDNHAQVYNLVRNNEAVGDKMSFTPKMIIG